MGFAHYLNILFGKRPRGSEAIRKYIEARSEYNSTQKRKKSCGVPR
jgi:hypothetical protein